MLLWAPVVRVMSFLTSRALRRELESVRPDAVVSTYPVASLVLGRMRKKKWLKVPVATFLTDFAVHPLWVHPGVDLHMAVSPVSAETAAKRGSRTNRASGPLVGDKFQGERPDRDAMRVILGIEPDERAVLVVAGSWGVGDMRSTVRAIAGCGEQYHPITVCGHDEKLRSELLAEGLGGTVLGWTDDMPGLMSAADALVENAGGLTRDGGLRRRGAGHLVPADRGTRQGQREVHGGRGRQSLRARRRASSPRRSPTPPSRDRPVRR